MYELYPVGERTYYVDCPAKMGLYELEKGEVCLIDSGNDRDAAKKVLKLLDAHDWKLSLLINTHSNADHIGGNRLLQERTGCRIVSTGLENAFIRFPQLEPSFLFGGYPCRELRNKFLQAQPSATEDLVEQSLPGGLEWFRLGGHFFDMIGVRTPDDVYFLADCLSGETVLEKYHFSFLYDVGAYLETLEWVKSLEGRWFIPAHAPVSESREELGALAEANRRKVLEIQDWLCALCWGPKSFEEILQAAFDTFGLTMDFNQYVLVGSTIRSHLAYLHDAGRLSASFQGNRLLWTAAEAETV